MNNISNLFITDISKRKMADWSDIQYFTRKEWLEGVDKIDPRLIYTLDYLRKWVGKPIRITSAFCSSGHSTDSTHYKGLAVDFYFIQPKFENNKSLAADTLLKTHTILEFLSRANVHYNGFGLGVYLDWTNSPGFHLDLRDKTISFWGRKNYEYTSISNILKYCVQILQT